MDKRHNGDEEADYNDEEENELFKVEYKNAEIEQQSVKEDAAEDDDEVMTVPPDGGWGWVVVVASFLIFMITEGIIYGFGIFFQEMINDLKCSRSQISMIAALKTSSICFSGNKAKLIYCLLTKIVIAYKLSTPLLRALTEP